MVYYSIGCSSCVVTLSSFLFFGKNQQSRPKEHPKIFMPSAIIYSIQDGYLLFGAFLVLARGQWSCAVNCNSSSVAAYLG